MRVIKSARLLAVVAGLGASLLAPPSASAATCSNSSAIYSSGAFGDTGTLWSCSISSTTIGSRGMSYNFCYLGQTNGAPATITTVGITAGGVSVPLHTFQFTTPRNTNVPCGNWGGLGTSITLAGFSRVEWRYTNGDWRLGISNIVVN